MNASAWMVSVGLKPLIDGKVETEKRKRYRFQHDAGKVKRGRGKDHGEEDVNEAAVRTAAHAQFFLLNLLPLEFRCGYSPRPTRCAAQRQA